MDLALPPSADRVERLEKEFKELVLEANLLHHEIATLSAASGVGPEHEDALSKLKFIGSGNISAVAARKRPCSAQTLAREVLKEDSDPSQILVDDLVAYINWLNTSRPQPLLQEVKDRINARAKLLRVLLPTSIRWRVDQALAYTEMKAFTRSFVNTTTMYEEEITDIPADTFFASKDNYAWDLEELVQCLLVNGGVMRNPLTKVLFAEEDIQLILSHPLGEPLKVQCKAQEELRKGVRAETIEKVAELGEVMLEDDSEDGSEAREAMDEFLAFVATLPVNEQQTLKDLKIPARDKHTGQPYDYTILDSVTDGKANTTCFHKVGDFLSQAAEHLNN